MPLLDSDFSTAINQAIKHAVNYHGIDTKCDMADWQIADLLTEEVCKHIRGETSYQEYGRSTMRSVQ